MPTPRPRLISLDNTPWYHCVSRCVRRAWLCGYDSNTGKDYEYRRERIVERLEHLSHAFSIEIAGSVYSLCMSRFIDGWSNKRLSFKYIPDASI